MTIIIVANAFYGNATVVTHAPNFTEARAWFAQRNITKSRSTSKQWDLQDGSPLRSFFCDDIASRVAAINHTRTFPASVDHFVLRNVGEVENPDSLITIPTPHAYLKHNPDSGQWVLLSASGVIIDNEAEVSTSTVNEEDHTGPALIYAPVYNDIELPLLVFPSRTEAVEWLTDNGFTSTDPERGYDFYNGIPLEQAPYETDLMSLLTRNNSYDGGNGEIWVLRIRNIEFGQPLVDCWDFD